MTGAAAVLQTPQGYQIILRTRLPNYTSIFSAELYAIYASRQIIQERDLHMPSIVSDLKSALTAMNPRNRSQHPTIYKIFDILKTLAPTRTTKFLWIPSQCQIPGNEKADIEAKKATKHNNCFEINPSKEEYSKMIREHISAKHQIEWDHTGNSPKSRILGNFKSKLPKNEKTHSTQHRTHSSDPWIHSDKIARSKCPTQGCGVEVETGVGVDRSRPF